MPKDYHWDFPGGLVAKTPCSQCRGPGFRTSSNVLQLRPDTAKYINKYIFLKQKGLDQICRSVPVNHQLPEFTQTHIH